jgi:Tol biopolymer transport system component
VLSADGRYVAFQSYATNLIAGQVDTNQTADVFLYDRTIGAVTLVSHTAGAATTACNTTAASRPGPAISPDGRYVAFESGATDLVPGQVDTNGEDDVFLYDRLSGNVALVSHANGDPATAGNDQSLLSYQVSSHALLVTDDGHVVFLSTAKDLVAGQSGVPDSPAVFLYDAASGTTALVSHTAGSTTLPAAGACDRPALSADGRSVAFDSTASDLMTGQVDGNGSYDAFLYDVTSGANTLVSHVPGSPGTAGNATAFDLSLSDDGQRVTFSSQATDLVQDQVTRYPYTHVFLWHRDTGTVALASHTAGVETTTGTDYSGRPVISGDGGAIAFMSFGGDLVGGDANGAEDVYVYTETTPGPPTGLFFTVSPCRLFDSRQGGGALPSGIHWPLAAAGSCHIPATAVAVAVNVTAVRPTGEGYLTLHSSDVAAPLASSLNFGPGQTRTNNVVLPLATSPSRLGSFAISPFISGNGAVDVVVDIFGYFE